MDGGTIFKVGVLGPGLSSQS